MKWYISILEIYVTGIIFVVRPLDKNLLFQLCRLWKPFKRLKAFDNFRYGDRKKKKSTRLIWFCTVSTHIITKSKHWKIATNQNSRCWKNSSIHLIFCVCLPIPTLHELERNFLLVLGTKDLLKVRWATLAKNLKYFFLSS